MFQTLRLRLHIFRFTLLGMLIKANYITFSKTLTNHIDLPYHLLEEQYIYLSWHGCIGAMLHFLTVVKPPKLAIIMSNNPQNYICIPLFKHLGITIIRQDDHQLDQFSRAKKIHRYLKEGYSIFNFADGPTGPNRQLKKDMLVFSKKYNVPVLPIFCSLDDYTPLRKAWDHSYVINKKTKHFFVSHKTPFIVSDIEADGVLVEQQLNQLVIALADLEVELTN